jgi:hypothetical protein
MITTKTVVHAAPPEQTTAPIQPDYDRIIREAMLEREQARAEFFAAVFAAPARLLAWCRRNWRRSAAEKARHLAL